MSKIDSNTTYQNVHQAQLDIEAGNDQYHDINFHVVAMFLTRLFVLFNRNHRVPYPTNPVIGIRHAAVQRIVEINTHFHVKLDLGMVKAMSEYITSRNIVVSALSNAEVEDHAGNIAKLFEAAGYVPNNSTGIHEGPTRGYGTIDFNGFWMFPLDVE
jgi:hypothetical protein